ncbi:MAG: hypothetical protein AAFY38_15220 [Pseudomonadota bacterium]
MALSGAASAAPISVRSGDHAGFTRLAFDLPGALPWVLEAEGRRVTLRFSGHSAGFDTDAVFDRIDRTRIARVAENGDGLLIELNCDCVAEAFDVSARMVALDVRPTVAKAASAQLKAPAAVPAVSGPPLPVVTQADSLEQPEPVPDTAGLLDSLQQELTREVASATTQGVLAPNGLPMPSPGESAVEPTRTDRSKLPEVSVVPPPANSSIRITSSLDVPLRDASGADLTSEIGEGCIPAAEVAVADWSDGRSMPEQISDLRQSLFNERDGVDGTVAVTLARTYIHFGFGPEAMRVLQLDPDLQRHNGALIEMGEIMEYGHVRSPRLLHRGIECDGAPGLWAMLADPETRDAAAFDVKGILRELSALPLHLREILAPELSRRLLAYGEMAAAEAALRVVERVPTSVGPDAQFAKATIDMAAGDIASAQAGLEAVVDSNSAQSAKALIAYVDSRLAEGQPVSQDTALLVQAYLNELRGGPLEPELRRAQVLSLAQSSQFDAAFEIMNTSDVASDASKDLRTTVLRRLTEQADDIVFLSHVFAELSSISAQTDADTRLELATRLVALGFPHQAEMALRPVVPRLNEPDARRLKARIALDQRKPALALAHLLGLNSEEDLRLSAKAKEMAGDLEGASALFAQLDDKKAADRTALLSGSWASRLAQSEEAFGALADIAGADMTLSPELNGMLGRSRAALLESAQSRRTLEALVLGSEAQQN